MKTKRKGYNYSGSKEAWAVSAHAFLLPGPLAHNKKHRLREAMLCALILFEFVHFGYACRT
jgi:hypothetical protein